MVAKSPKGLFFIPSEFAIGTGIIELAVLDNGRWASYTVTRYETETQKETEMGNQMLIRNVEEGHTVELDGKTFINVAKVPTGKHVLLQAKRDCSFPLERVDLDPDDTVESLGETHDIVPIAEELACYLLDVEYGSMDLVLSRAGCLQVLRTMKDHDGMYSEWS